MLIILYNFFITAIFLLFRVPLRLIIGKEKRNKLLSSISFYHKISMEYSRFGYNEDYEAMYGNFNYNNKTVLDIGADFGSTPKFFLNKGAKLIIAVEGSLSKYSQLRNNMKKSNVKPIHLWINSSTHYEKLLNYTPFDIAKIDCEGCEKFLLDVNRKIFRLIPYYIIETHNELLFKKFIDKFKHYNYSILSINTLHYNPQVTVIHANRK